METLDGRAPRGRQRLLMVITLAGAIVAARHGFAADASDAGMRVYRDPATGEFTAPPPNAPDLVQPRALATGTEAPLQGELIETPGTSAAGGVTIDLQGRFHSDESATVDGPGNVTVRCHTTTDGGARP